MMSVSFRMSSASRQFLSTVVQSSAANPIIFNLANFGSATTPSPPKNTEFPKRPMSAYLKFAQDARPMLPKTASMLDSSKLLSQKWKELPNEKKQVYVDRAKTELDDWKSKTSALKTEMSSDELEDYNSSHKKKRVARTLRKVSADHKHLLVETEKPKRYPLAHSLYIKEKLPDMRVKHPDIPVSGLFRSIVQEFKGLPEETKSKYLVMSDKLKAEYLDAMAKWTDKINKSGKAEDLEKAKEKIRNVKEKNKKDV